MAGFKLTPAAFQDFEDIARYTRRRWGNAQCDLYLRALDRRFAALAVKPSLGRPRDDVREGYRGAKEGRHLIFFREAKGGIEIVRILHESMDVESRLQKAQDSADET